MIRGYEAEGLALVDVYPTPTEYVVNWIEVDGDHRGLGVGTAFLRSVCHDADRAGMRLVGVPVAERGREASLRRFYERHGFVKNGRIVVRQPRKGLLDGRD